MGIILVMGVCFVMRVSLVMGPSFVMVYTTSTIERQGRGGGIGGTRSGAFYY